jgi:hypothetical protein
MRHRQKARRRRRVIAGRRTDRKAQVRYLGQEPPAVKSEQHVVRLHVAVHEAVAVHKREAGDDAPRDCHALCNRRGVGASTVGFDPTCEVTPRDVLHNHRLCGLSAHTVHTSHVGVVQRTHDGRFVDERWSRTVGTESAPLERVERLHRDL